MNVVDVVVLVIVALAAVQGLRLGAIVQVLSFGGFWSASTWAPCWHRSPSGGSTPSRRGPRWPWSPCWAWPPSAGWPAGSSATWPSPGCTGGCWAPVDSVLGVVVAVVASLLVAWLLASTLVNSSSLSSQRVHRPLEDHPVARQRPAGPAVGLLPGPELPLRRGVPAGLRPAGPGVGRSGVAARRCPAAGGGRPRRRLHRQDHRRRLRSDPGGIRVRGRSRSGGDQCPRGGRHPPPDGGGRERALTRPRSSRSTRPSTWP